MFFKYMLVLLENDNNFIFFVIKILFYIIFF